MKISFGPVTRFANRNALKIKKNSPQILFYGGLIGTVATTVLASRATLKAVPVMERLKTEREFLNTYQAAEEITEQAYTQEVVRQYTVTAIDLTKLYTPVVVVGVGSLAALTKSHKQLVTRNTALTVAYTGLFKTFEAYRGRVREKLGDNQDLEFLHGTVKQEVEYLDKNGNLASKQITALDPKSKSALTHMYDASVSSWCKDPSYNQNFLDNQQDWANILLQKQGHLFLNEVYDLLHIPHTREGNILGWVYEDLGNNDTFVNFGHHKDGEFVAGYKRDVMLEFNIHGPILDLI